MIRRPPSDPSASVPDDPAALREALAGVRALVLDADGVLVHTGLPLPGAIEAIAALDARNIPFRVATNLSSVHRSTIADRFGQAGMAIGIDRIVTAASATAGWTAVAYRDRPILVLTGADGRREFAGQRLVGPDDPDPTDGPIAAVVLGDADDDLGYTTMDRAFRLLRGGAELVAMHRNPWWWTRKGPTLDAGAFVVALEFATGRPARVCGKPSPIMYRTAFAGLRADIRASGGRRLRLAEVAMVGDDLRQDIAGAHRAGLRGALVLTGKTSAAEAEALRAGAARRGGRPSAALPWTVAGALGEVVAALD